MEQHEGSLTAYSEGLGHGTTFSMALPLYDIPVISKMENPLVLQSSSSSDESSSTSFVSSEGKKCITTPEGQESIHSVPRRCHPNILVVDDSKMNRKLLLRLLQNRGYICEEATNGKEAVEMVQRRQQLLEGNQEEQPPYDTILLDNEMPIMKGPEACWYIRNKLQCNCYIFGLTGNVMKEDVDEFMSCGADDVLAKPFQMKDLEAAWSKNQRCIQKKGNSG
jgi:CheY-like chemotaxis protein